MPEPSPPPLPIDLSPWRRRAILGVRAALGGALMGLANVVPGVSGATMLLAAGIYPQFVSGVADISHGRLRRGPLLIVATVAVAAVLTIALAAGTIRDLVVHERWVMYSLFIGLTLGGVPVLRRMIGKLEPRVWASAAVGVAMMAGIVWLQSTQPAGPAGGGAEGVGLTWGWMFLAGLAGAAAMILPGLSGSYLLLVLGLYVPVLTAIALFRDALGALAWESLWAVAWGAILPIGLGVVAGVVGVSHILRWLLTRYEKLTLGVLLGLLVGAVLGLWPYQQGVEPAVGEVIAGQRITEEDLAAMQPQDYPLEFFTPTLAQVALSLVLMAAGFALTTGVARVTRRLERDSAPTQT